MDLAKITILLKLKRQLPGIYFKVYSPLFYNRNNFSIFPCVLFSYYILSQLSVFLNLMNNHFLYSLYYHKEIKNTFYLAHI